MEFRANGHHGEPYSGEGGRRKGVFVVHVLRRSVQKLYRWLQTRSSSSVLRQCSRPCWVYPSARFTLIQSMALHFFPSWTSRGPTFGSVLPGFPRPGERHLPVHHESSTCLTQSALCFPNCLYSVRLGHRCLYGATSNKFIKYRCATV